jgi:sulfofructose kinase
VTAATRRTGVPQTSTRPLLSSTVWDSAPPKWDVVGVGENSVDEVLRLPELPAATGPASKLPILSRAVRCGGQVATALATCASFGLRTAYIGVFGNDEHGVRLRAELERRGIDLGHAQTRQAPNRRATILVDERRGGRIVLWERDPAIALSPADIPANDRDISAARLLHIDTVDEEAASWAADHAGFSGVYVSSDFDRVTKNTRDLIKRVDLAIFAEHVPEVLTREADPGRALRSLQRKRHVLLCVTLGARGALLLHGHRLYRAPTFKVKAVDTTGAGDVFRGALIYAVLERRGGPRDALRFAAAAAALSCTREGAIDSVPSLADVEALAATGA